MHGGHRERMRKKLINSDGAEFYQHELLEMLLYSTIPQKDTNPLAHSLIEEFGSFSAVFDADYGDLLKVNGIGVTSATLIKLIPLVAAAYLQDKNNLSGKYIRGDRDAFLYVLPKYVNLTDEMSSALLMNNSGKVLGWERLGMGTINVTEIPIRKLMTYCIKYNATQIILFHNHPSGVAIPSHNDVVTTKNIIDALAPISVKIADHIIIGGDDYVSMASSAEFAFLFN